MTSLPLPGALRSSSRARNVSETAPKGSASRARRATTTISSFASVTGCNSKRRRPVRSSSTRTAGSTAVTYPADSARSSKNPSSRLSSSARPLSVVAERTSPSRALAVIVTPSTGLRVTASTTSTDTAPTSATAGVAASSSKRAFSIPKTTRWKLRDMARPGEMGFRGCALACAEGPCTSGTARCHRIERRP
jgi:hypothetical protein